MQRRQFLQGTAMAAVSGAAAPAVRAQAQTPTKPARVALAWINNVEYAGLWVGEDKGYFKEEGIEVKTLSGGPNAPPPQVTIAAGGRSEERRVGKECRSRRT